MKNKRRLDRWAIWTERVAAWRASGLLQADYCRENNLEVRHFSLWKRKIEQDGGNAASRFVEIPPKVLLNNKPAALNQRNKVTVSVKLDEITITLER